MKRLLLYILTIGLTTLTTYYVTTNTYKDYIKATERLLEDLEIMCEDNDLLWGDTICEGDSWSDYVDACKKIRIEK